MIQFYVGLLYFYIKCKSITRKKNFEYSNYKAIFPWEEDQIREKDKYRTRLTIAIISPC